MDVVQAARSLETTPVSALENDSFCSLRTSCLAPTPPATSSIDAHFRHKHTHISVSSASASATLFVGAVAIFTAHSELDASCSLPVTETQRFRLVREKSPGEGRPLLRPNIGGRKASVRRRKHACPRYSCQTVAVSTFPIVPSTLHKCLFLLAVAATAAADDGHGSVLAASADCVCVGLC